VVRSSSGKRPTRANPEVLDDFARPCADGVVLRVIVQPRASRSEPAGIQQGALKLRLTAPPVEGAANEECIRLLAKLLDVPASRLRLISGHKSRRKTIVISGVDISSVKKRLQSPEPS
jgi:uncharacterized protein